jgi:hypothetical protein
MSYRNQQLTGNEHEISEEIVRFLFMVARTTHCAVKGEELK